MTRAERLAYLHSARERYLARTEDAVAELLGRVFDQPASSYTSQETRESVSTVFFEKRPGLSRRQRMALRDGLSFIHDCGLDIGRGRILVRQVRREDWAESWKRHFKPLEIGSRLLLKPSWSTRKPKNGQALVIECNLRASRSMPFVSKTIGTNLMDLAAEAAKGGDGTGICAWIGGELLFGFRCEQELGETGRSDLQADFGNLAGVGFDAYVVYRLALDFKFSLGVVAYAIEALRQTFRHSFPPLTCRLDGQKLEGTLAVIQRTQLYAGWFHLAPAASLFEPKLNLCLFTSRSRWRYFAYIAAVVARLHPRLRDVTMMDATRIHCAALAPDTPIHFEVDGELGGTLPATFEVVPDALTLLAPATSAAAGQPSDS